MRVLGLDVGVNVGWAFFKSEDAPPLCGIKVLPKAFDENDIAARTWPLRQWLRDMVAVHKPDVVGFESPFIPVQRRGPQESGKSQFVTTQATLRLLISLSAEIETTCKELGVRCMEVASSSGKIALAGSARLGNSKERKEAMVAAATDRGWDVSDKGHDADACGVALVVFDQ